MEQTSQEDQGSLDLSGGQQVIIAATDTPTSDVTTVVTTIPTTQPISTDTTFVATQPTDIPTTDVTTAGPAGTPPDNESAASPLSLTAAVPDQPIGNTTGDLVPGGEPSNNTSAPSDKGSGNTTPDLQADNGIETLSNLTATTDVTNSTPGTNTTVTELCNSTPTIPDANLTISLSNTTSPYDLLTDPPLNTSLGNVYYDNISGCWVINQSGEYYLDLIR